MRSAIRDWIHYLSIIIEGRIFVKTISMLGFFLSLSLFLPGIYFPSRLLFCKYGIKLIYTAETRSG